MAENRTPRDLVSREKSARAVYVPPSNLPDPTPEPGYLYRWVATHVMGQSDPTNVSKKMREGWEPVKAADHPELQLFGNQSGNVEIGGLMLCKMSIEQANARTEYYARPGALPTVERSSLRQDLFRRDFSLNAMAACINPDCFGTIADPFGGLRDLERGTLRVLHSLSFVEDPTRVLRGASGRRGR